MLHLDFFPFYISAPSDYAESTQVFTFSEVALSFQLILLIADDSILEQSESFFVHAEFVAVDEPGVMLDPDQTDVTIDDNDSKSLALHYTFIQACK